MLNRSYLHDYQEKAVDFIIEKKRCGLFLDMGLGKTISTLTAIVDLIDSFAVHKVLVVAPLRVAKTVWHNEADNWQHTKHLKINVCVGTERKRLAQLYKQSDVVVINRENVTWLVNHYADNWPFDFVVVDESSGFKNASSKRFKAFKKVLHLTDYFLILTGTPSPNGLIDLWSQIYFLDYGERLGRTVTNFKQRFFEKTGYMGYQLKPYPGAEAKIYSLIADKTISMKACDYLELPDCISINEKVKLSAKIQNEYKDFERNLFIDFQDEELQASSAAVLAGKLLQWCSGAVYLDETKRYKEIHSEKLDVLEEIIEDNLGENILVAYNFRSDLERLKKRFPGAVVLDKNEDTVRKWNAGEISLLLAHPASAGHGLNLQKGGALAVWFSLTWSLELYQQFNARLHRQGQDKPVRIVHIVVEGCLDERVIKVLADKDVTQRNLISALKVKI